MVDSRVLRPSVSHCVRDSVTKTTNLCPTGGPYTSEYRAHRDTVAWCDRDTRVSGALCPDTDWPHDPRQAAVNFEGTRAVLEALEEL